MEQPGVEPVACSRFSLYLSGREVRNAIVPCVSCRKRSIDLVNHGSREFEVGPKGRDTLPYCRFVDNNYRKPVFGDDAVEDLLGSGLLLSDGEAWRHQRQLANEAFDPSRFTDLTGTMAAYAEELVDGWSDGDVVDIRQQMAAVTVRIIVEAMFGTTIDDETTRTIQEALEPLGARFEPDATRFLLPNWLPTAENRSFRDALETLEAVLDEIVAERRRGDLTGEDLLSVLLSAQRRDEQTDRQLRDELVTMLLAGHDTTALTLTYTLFLLDRNPNARRRLYAEFDAIDGRPGLADFRTLEYTDRVLEEAMRLYLPVYTLFREPTVDVEVAGYDLPAESLVMIPQWVVHRSPRYYDDPETFDPDRWLPERSADRPRFAFFPFGGGPRICIGKQFSLLELTVILATIFRTFDLKVVDDGPLELRPSLTMHPRNPVRMRLCAR